MDPDGYVVVNWEGGRRNKRGMHRPHELYKVESEGEESESEDSSEDDDDDENTSENEAWETASEDGHDELLNGNTENDRLNVFITGIFPSPSQSEEPTSPVVDNVDVEALNNANNVGQLEEATDGSNKGIKLLIKCWSYST